MRFYVVAGTRVVLTCGEHVHDAIAAVGTPTLEPVLTHQPEGEFLCGHPFDPDPLSSLLEEKDARLPG